MPFFLLNFKNFFTDSFIFLIYLDKFWLIYSQFINLFLLIIFIILFGIILLNTAKHVKILNLISAFYLIIFFFLISLNYNYNFFFINLSYNQNITLFVNLFIFISILTTLIFFLGICDVFFSEENSKIEFSFLIWFIFISAIFLISSVDFIAIIILLECIAFSSYVLVGFERKNKFSTTSALKYLILASIPSGIFILGITLFYNNFGTFSQDYLNLIFTALTNINSFTFSNFDKICLNFWIYINEIYFGFFFNSNIYKIFELISNHVYFLNLYLESAPCFTPLTLIEVERSFIQCTFELSGYQMDLNAALLKNDDPKLVLVLQCLIAFQLLHYELLQILYEILCYHYFTVIKEFYFFQYFWELCFKILVNFDFFSNKTEKTEIIFSFLKTNSYNTILNWFILFSVQDFFLTIDGFIQTFPENLQENPEFIGLDVYVQVCIEKFLAPYGQDFINILHAWNLVDYHKELSNSEKGLVFDLMSLCNFLNLIVLFEEKFQIQHLLILDSFKNYIYTDGQLAFKNNFFFNEKFFNYFTDLKLVFFSLFNLSTVTEMSFGIFFQNFLQKTATFNFLNNFENTLYYTDIFLIIYLIIIFFLINISFKLTAAPFHFWAPSVYGGAPLPTLTFISIFSKLTIIFFTIWLFLNTMDSLKHIWQPLVLLISFLSIFFSILGAFSEKLFKRFFIYSSIGHVGFILIGLSVLNISGIKGSFDYLVLYILSSFIIWFIVMYLTKKTMTLVNLKGLSFNYPFLSLIFSITMFSLSGIPPFGGFFVKYEIFYSIINSSLFYFAYFLLILTVISFFYYLRIIKIIFFENNKIFIQPKQIFDIKLRLISYMFFLIPFFMIFIENPLNYFIKEIFYKSLF